MTHYHHIDPSVLLEAVGHDRAAFNDIAGVFIRTAPPSMTRIDAAITSSDWEAARHECHKLKGSSRLLGAVRLSAILQALETAFTQGHSAEGAGLVDAVKPELDQVLAELAHCMNAAA